MTTRWQTIAINHVRVRHSHSIIVFHFSRIILLVSRQSYAFDSITIVIDDSIPLTDSSSLLTISVELILPPRSLIPSVISQPKYTIAMPVIVKMLSLVLIRLIVTWSSNTLSHVLLKHSLIQEAIIVEDGTNTMFLTFFINLTIVNIIWFLYFDEFLTKIWWRRRI